MNIGLMDCIAAGGLRGVGKWCTGASGQEGSCWANQVPTSERPDVPTQGLRALGAYPTSYPAVTKFQTLYNELQPEIDEIADGRFYPLGRKDGIWGKNTNYAFWGYSEFRHDQACGAGWLPVNARNSGPRVVAACLTEDGFSAAEIEQLQTAWSEYRAYERSGGAPADIPSDETPVYEAPATNGGKKKESSVWPWILGGGALVVLGIILLKKKR